MYERLASDIDLEEEAEIIQLEGLSPAVVPTVMNDFKSVTHGFM